MTENEFLEPVLRRLKVSPQIECVVLENVPNIAKMLEGQDRSSYSLWVDGLTQCGFIEHAYVILKTAAAGDLHHRVRLLSVHTRGAFHPAAALMRLLDSGEVDSGASTMSETQKSNVFAFTTGLSETRAQFKGSMMVTFGALPAYNTALNVALYVRGAYYKLSPWLAARCSGLPDDYQSVWDFGDGDRGPRKQPLQTCVSTALGNMVSPLQARELGYAIASEWLAPRKLADVSTLEGAPALRPDETFGYDSGVPTEFPRTRGEAEATLCFSSTSTGMWHRAVGRPFHRVGPAASLDVLCDEALRSGELHCVTSLTELNRCADDTSLHEHHRRHAARQYARIQSEANEELRQVSRLALTRVKRSHGGRRCTWAQCDSCLRWRRLTLAPAGASQLPDHWTCSMNPDPPFNHCDIAEEEMDVDEGAPGWNDDATTDPFTAESDRWLTVASDQVSSPMCLKRQQALQCSIANPSFLSLNFDFYFKSRTAEELEARGAELKRRRAGTLVLVVDHGDQEAAETPQDEPRPAREEGGGEDHEEVDDDVSDGEAGSAGEEEDDEEARPIKIIKHHVYSGAKAGSLYNVYVKVRYEDGLMAGGDCRAMEPAEHVCATIEGSAVLAAYCRTERGQAIAKYVPALVLVANEIVDDVERARREGAISAVIAAAAIRRGVDERFIAKRQKLWPRSGRSEDMSAQLMHDGAT